MINANTFDGLLLLGDINADFIRNSDHSTQVLKFIHEANLTCSWNKFEIDFTYCYESDSTTRYATLDHFFWNEMLCDKIMDAGVLHSVDNLSDHSPIYCSINLGMKSNDKIEKVNDVPKPKWNLAQAEEKLIFKVELNRLLSAIQCPSSLLQCRDVHCKDDQHCNDADEFMANILDSVDNAARSILPCSKGLSSKVKGHKVRPGWVELVKPYRDKSLFWHQVWISAGKPLNCELHNVMKHAKNQYHYQIRKLKKSEDTIRKNKLLDACLNGNGNLFTEIKNMRKHKPQVAASIDGINDDISDHFKEIYENLYNSVDDKREMEVIRDEVECCISSADLPEVDKVTPDILRKAASKLSDAKSDPLYSFSSDCLKNGPPLLFERLAVAFQSFLIHGHFTLYLLLATFIPIIKDKLGSISSSKNYRSIAISSLTLKLFDWIILILYGSELSLDPLQFAYQAGCSTTMCTWSVVETIDYFLRNGSNVYSCCMDMSKAFDSLKHSLLFKKLLQANMPYIFIRLLIFIYMEQCANVKWNGNYSNIFTVTNGVRQGGVSSAILYCFYCNILFEKLRKSGYGCWVNGIYSGIFGYSDDNLLLAPSLFALQKMLTICEEFAEEHNLKFSTDENPSKCKTKCTVFSYGNPEVSDMRLCGNILPWVSEFKHLGNTISNVGGLTDQDIVIKRAQFISKNIEIRQEFYFASARTKFLLNQIYNTHFTGSPLWDLFGNHAKRLEGSYNLAVKNMFNKLRLSWAKLSKAGTGMGKIGLLLDES